MLPTFMSKKTIARKPEPSSPGRVERVHLLAWPRHMDALGYKVGVIEGNVGDEVLVRFGEIVVQVPADMLEAAEDSQ